MTAYCSIVARWRRIALIGAATGSASLINDLAQPRAVFPRPGIPRSIYARSGPRIRQRTRSEEPPQERARSLPNALRRICRVEIDRRPAMCAIAHQFRMPRGSNREARTRPAFRRPGPGEPENSCTRDTRSTTTR
jgi:hypothetical protein